MAGASAPAWACGGLIGRNGAVNLLRTTTLAGYHDGVEHYVTAFDYNGAGGKFGSLVPLIDDGLYGHVDLTAADGMRPGTVLSLRRDRIPIVHPVTGEMLGELDEEVATARVTELKDKFSVAEIQTLAQGAEVRVKDRVVPK